MTECTIPVIIWSKTSYWEILRSSTDSDLIVKRISLKGQCYVCLFILCHLQQYFSYIGGRFPFHLSWKEPVLGFFSFHLSVKVWSYIKLTFFQVYKYICPTNCTQSRDIVLFLLWGNMLQADSALSRKYLKICWYVKLFWLISTCILNQIPQNYSTFLLLRLSKLRPSSLLRPLVLVTKCNFQCKWVLLMRPVHLVTGFIIRTSL